MDYKDTLNLPRTDFPMKADLVAREPERIARWEAARLYQQIQSTRAGQPRFVLHDGPPFANGDVHIGTALNKILKDIVVKYQSIRGRQAPYIPGWDCHGLPIEFKVTQEMRKGGNTAADPATIRRECEAYARRFIDIQRAQFRRLGVLADWDQPYLTFDRAYEAEELRLFAAIVEQGYVYRGKKPIYWSIPCRTALAEAEVEYQDHVSQSIFVKFPILGHPGTSLVIWTTTPWTLPANLAVAFNSTFDYSLVRVTREEVCEDFIVSALLLGAVAAKCGWENYQIVRTLRAEELRELEYQHPFCARTGRLHPGDDFVENTTGTGFVHIAPGHGLEDYHLGQRVGLPVYSPVDDDGRFAHTGDLPVEQQMPGALLGLSILKRQGKSDANEGVLEELRSRHLLLHQEDYSHSYPHCWRSKTPVIFRAMDQWFIRVDHAPAGQATFRTRALEEIGRVQWIPDWGRVRIESAVKSRPDWCISRQRSWGVPIPAFYDGEGRPILDARVIRAAADLLGQHGSNVWFERSASELWNQLRPAGWSGPEAIAKSSDTLDVWIDSGSSSRSVIAARPEIRGEGSRPFQCDMYLEGSDQHRGWFQSSLLLSLAGQGAAPYRTVLTHGFMVDEDREKISKSKQGGYEKPQTSDAYVRKWGADVVRLWVASQDFRNDIMVSDKRIEKVGETYRIVRNALRYQLSNLFDFQPETHAVPDERLTPLDRWILDAFARLEDEVVVAMDAHEFHVAYQKISQFASVELSAMYHDVVKDRLYTDAAGSVRRRSTQTALHRMVTGLCGMLAPILSFTADEAWEHLPGKPTSSVHLAVWTPRPFERTEEERASWTRLLNCREQALAELERARQSKLIGKSLEAKALLEHGPELSFTAEQNEILRELLNVSQLETHASSEAGARLTVTRAVGTKCERCWHMEADIGGCAEHPTLCGRCATAVTV